MVNTFLPVADFQESCEILDSARLGKQRSEIKILLAALTGIRFKQAKGEFELKLPEKRGYMNHSAARMWKGHEFQLAHLGHVNCLVWMKRFDHPIEPGATGWDTLCDMYAWKHYLFKQGADTTLPEWWGREDVHRSHREVLLFKDDEFYRQYGWTEEPKYEYVWPV